MRLLLETPALLWWLAGDVSLIRRAREAMEDEGAEVFVSAASNWELSTKHRSGRLPGLDTVMRDLCGAISAQGFLSLPITLRHGEVAGGLPGPHRDPFDRMLIAQAMIEDLCLISNETLFNAYGVGRLW